MINRKHRLLSLILCITMLLSLTVTVAVFRTSAASGDIVYCENADGWAEVYCYMWKDGLGDNGGWPGQKMTKVEDNLWSYNFTDDWNMIIFNNGSSDRQTSDMTYPGSGSCYNNKTKDWSQSDVPTNPTNPTVPTPTTPDNSANPTNPTTPLPADKNVVFCKNDAGWSKVNVYMWTDGQGNNKDWPGVAATSIGDDIWMLEYDKEWSKIIFNDGNGTQTQDLNHPGSGQMYNNKTGQWSLYDTKSLHIKGVSADPASPQYTGVGITLSVNAGGGEGTLSYKFVATAGSKTTVIRDFSADNTVVWTPTAAGNYTITYTVKDEAGVEKSQDASYMINDINAETKPVMQRVNVTPTDFANKEILKGKETLIDITAGGGNTGTKLLFYKVRITDPDGKIANVPFYTTKNQYKFIPASLGEYKIEISVQGSDNSTITKEYKYESVAELSAPGALVLSVSKSGSQTVGSTVTVTGVASGGVAPYSYQFMMNGQVVKEYSTANSYVIDVAALGLYEVEVSVKDSEDTVTSKTISFTVSVSQGGDMSKDYLKGDADCDGKVNIKDATAIQKHVADIITLSAQGLENAEVDGSGNLTVKDATMVQKHIAGMDVNW